jgi:hypothetical protein
MLRLVERIDYWSYERLSLLNWLTRWIPRWYENMSVVENYVLSWLFVELAFFAAILIFPDLTNQTLFVILAMVLLIYRWFNIISYWFHAHVLAGRVSSPVRALILTLINFAELVVIFAILDFIISSAFAPAFTDITNSLDYSIRVMTTLGWDKYEPGGFGYVLFYIQIYSGIGTIAIVIGSVMSYFTRER